VVQVDHRMASGSSLTCLALVASVAAPVGARALGEHVPPVAAGPPADGLPFGLRLARTRALNLVHAEPTSACSRLADVSDTQGRRGRRAGTTSIAVDSSTVPAGCDESSSYTRMVHRRR
jgi:hypothetical protein